MKRKAVNTEKKNERVAEQEALKYLGYGPSSDNWHDLDIAWAKNFLKAKKIIDQKAYVALKEKVRFLFDKGRIERGDQGTRKREFTKLPKKRRRRRAVKTELELLSIIPLPIHYPDLDKSTTTTKSTTAQTPTNDFQNFTEDGEVKTFWVLYLDDDEKLHERYEEDLKRK
ncbi:2043_t:CDS:2, partial [Cetraspora pellucida]